MTGYRPRKLSQSGRGCHSAHASPISISPRLRRSTLIDAGAPAGGSKDRGRRAPTTMLSGPSPMLRVTSATTRPSAVARLQASSKTPRTRQRVRRCAQALPDGPADRDRGQR